MSVTEDVVSKLRKWFLDLIMFSLCYYSHPVTAQYESVWNCGHRLCVGLWDQAQSFMGFLCEPIPEKLTELSRCDVEWVWWPGYELSGGNGCFLRALLEAAVFEAGFLEALENAPQHPFCPVPELSSGLWERSPKVRSSLCPTSTSSTSARSAGSSWGSSTTLTAPVSTARKGWRTTSSRQRRKTPRYTQLCFRVRGHLPRSWARVGLIALRRRQRMEHRAEQAGPSRHGGFLKKSVFSGKEEQRPNYCYEHWLLWALDKTTW